MVLVLAIISVDFAFCFASSQLYLSDKSPSDKGSSNAHGLLHMESDITLFRFSLTCNILHSALVQFEVEVYTGEIVPLYSKDNELLITLCGVDRSTEELPLETETDEAPELASNAVREICCMSPVCINMYLHLEGLCMLSLVLHCTMYRPPIELEADEQGRS